MPTLLIPPELIRQLDTHRDQITYLTHAIADELLPVVELLRVPFELGHLRVELHRHQWQIQTREDVHGAWRPVGQASVRERLHFIVHSRAFVEAYLAEVSRYLVPVELDQAEQNLRWFRTELPGVLRGET